MLQHSGGGGGVEQWQKALICVGLWSPGHGIKWLVGQMCQGLPGALPDPVRSDFSELVSYYLQLGGPDAHLLLHSQKSHVDSCQVLYLTSSGLVAVWWFRSLCIWHVSASFGFFLSYGTEMEAVVA